MSDNPTTSESAGRFNLIAAIKTPLGLFALVVMVAEGILVLLIAKADPGQRSFAIGGMLLVLLLLVSVVAFLAYRRPEALTLQGQTETNNLPNFEAIFGNLTSTLDNLESNNWERAKVYDKTGDFQRLLDGLYSALLYSSGAVPTGALDAAFYGNLMEIDGSGMNLRVRYFKGPYNDEVICRTFPIAGPKQGVASDAIVSARLQCRNVMEDELKERGESLLKAMISIPVTAVGGKPTVTGEIAVINVDSFVGGIFPVQGSANFKSMERRADALAGLARRINRLRAVLTPKSGTA